VATQPAEMTVHSSQPYNAEPPRRALADRDLTPVEAFYHRNHAVETPRIDPASWVLRVDGRVERPATFSLGALRERFAEHTDVVTLQCAGNRRAGLLEVADLPGETPWGPGATGTARWAGVRLADVLRDVGVAPDATDVRNAQPTRCSPKVLRARSNIWTIANAPTEQITTARATSHGSCSIPIHSATSITVAPPSVTRDDG